jgi:hypothetical protein
VAAPAQAARNKVAPEKLSILVEFDWKTARKAADKTVSLAQTWAAAQAGAFSKKYGLNKGGSNKSYLHYLFHC